MKSIYHPKREEIHLTLNQKMDECLLLTSTVYDFRKEYTELIAQWERQIGQDNCHPDLHFVFA
jgi:hypothetical protein